MAEIIGGPSKEKQTILFVGTFLSSRFGTMGISEIISTKLRTKGWHVITTSSHPNRALRLIDIVWTAWSRRNDYDIAHVDVYSGLAFIWAEVVCKIFQLLHKPYILTLRGGNLPSLLDQSSNRAKELLSQANLVTTPSRYLIKELSCIHPTIKYLPNGLDLDEYPFRLRSCPKPELGWLRAFHSIYNPLLAVETINLLKENFPPIHLSMIGPDKEDGSYNLVIKAIIEHKLENNISLVGKIPKSDVPNYLRKFDVFLNTTNFESFGVGVMEAGAVGLPIITSNVGELSYLWVNDKEALLVPPDDAQSMAAAVSRVLTEVGLSERLSKNARHKAEQFDWSTLLPIWEDLFNRAARRS